MSFAQPPHAAAWWHHGARDGFEVVFLRSTASGYRLEGHTAAVQDAEAWAVGYAISVDLNWVTQSARVQGRSSSGQREVALEVDGDARWRIDGAPARHLDGCRDVDLESSSFTNALPVRRLRMDVGSAAETPAAFVRALDLSVERLDQRYVRIENEGGPQCYDYASPQFDFRCRLVYDESGLLLDYPGIAIRAA